MQIRMMIGIARRHLEREGRHERDAHSRREPGEHAHDDPELRAPQHVEERSGGS